MAFSSAVTLVPSAIGEIEITLISPDPAGDESPRATFRVEVRYSDGSTRIVAGDLVPHLTPAQITGQLNFLDAMRAQAISQILP